jgi:predicted Zn-ribbon and HTH transcriptional regulator
MLIKLFDSSKDVELKRQILDYLGSSNNAQASEKLRAVAQSDAEPELRRHATEYILSNADAASLIRLYDESREPEQKAEIIDFLGSLDNQQAADKLLSIAQSAAEPELRRHAIDYIAGRPKSFDALVTLYDNSREPEIKRHILDYLGSSTDPRALDKLFAIAQSDPNRELRRLAVDYIGAR